MSSRTHYTQSFTEPEIRREINKAGAKWCFLENARGTKLLGIQSGKKTASKHLDDIFKLLYSAGLPDGLYIIKAKTSPRADVTPLEFPYLKGDASMSEAEYVFNPGANGTENSSMMGSPMELMRMMSENASLKTENRFLQDQLSRLEAKVDEKEKTIDELRTANSQLAEENVETKLEQKGGGMAEIVREGLTYLRESQEAKQHDAIEELKKIIAQQTNQLNAMSGVVKQMAEKIDEHEQLMYEGEDEQELYDEPASPANDMEDALN